MRRENRSTFRGAVLLDALVRHGLRTVCVAPGSRSTPLVLAAAEHEALRVLTHFDERSAAFLALGVARGSGAPAAVITTSGTAAANLLPAVVEAAQAGIPLLLLTADRPRALRGTDANQTINQDRLFGAFSRAFLEVDDGRPGPDAARRLHQLAASAVGAAMGPPAGPVQLNVPLARPLEPTAVAGDVPHTLDPAPDGTPPPAPAVPDLSEVIEAVGRAERPLFVAGPMSRPAEAGSALANLAGQTGIPLLADALSGARHTGAVRGVMGAYDAFLRDLRVAEALQPDVVVRFGPAPVSRGAADLLTRASGAAQFVVDDGTRRPEIAATRIPACPARSAAALADACSGPKAWLARWQAVEQETRRVLAEALAEAPFEPSVVRAAAGAAAGAEVPVLVGNSMPVRDWDRCVGTDVHPVVAYGNRGASGIDGMVSTAFGLSAGADSPVMAVLGDLTVFHDQNGFFAAREAGLAVVTVVVNNDGGGIFHHLPIREYEPVFTRHVVVPHGLDPRHTAALFGLPFERVDLTGNLDATLRDALRGGASALLEVRTDREQNRTRHAEVLARVSEALTALSGETA